MIYDNSNHMREHAAAWLTERGDLRELHEQRLETAEWAILSFVVVSVILDLLILITHARARLHGVCDKDAVVVRQAASLPGRLTLMRFRSGPRCLSATVRAVEGQRTSANDPKRTMSGGFCCNARS